MTKRKMNRLKSVPELAAVSILLMTMLLFTGCADDDDDEWISSEDTGGIHVNVELRIKVIGASDPNALVAEQWVNVESYRRTYNTTLFEWEKEYGRGVDLKTNHQESPDYGYTDAWKFEIPLFWRAPAHHDEIVMRAKIMGMTDDQWVESTYTYNDAESADKSEITVQREMVLIHPDY